MRLNGAILTLALSLGATFFGQRTVAQPTPPTIVPEVTADGSLRHYTYTLTNTATDYSGSPTSVWAIYIQFTTVGFNQIVAHNESPGWTFTWRGGHVTTEISWGNPLAVQPGGVVVFELFTPVGWPADYSQPGPPWNWGWSNNQISGSGRTFLPVPSLAPEPGTWAGILCGLGALALSTIRRRPT